MIRIQKVGDIHSRFAYLEVYIDQTSKPFLEIGVSAEETLCFKLYQSNHTIELGVREWKEILERANEHLSNVLEDERGLEDFLR